MYTFFEPELPSDPIGIARTKATDGLKLTGDRRSPLKLAASRNIPKSYHSRTPRPLPNPEVRDLIGGSKSSHTGRRTSSSPEKISWNVLDLKGENYFSCAVGRTRTTARYILGSSDDVVSFLKELADVSLSSSP